LSNSIQIPCVTKHFFPTTAENIIALAHKYLKEFKIHSNFTCCGLPFFENGDLISAKKTGEINLKLFENQDIHAFSEKCYQVFNTQYPQIFNNSFSHNEAQLIAKKTISLLDFLNSIPLTQTLQNQDKYFVAFDCSSNKQKQISCLNKIGIVEWASPNIQNTCCGAGTCLPIYSPELAKQMSNQLIEDAINSECSTIICFDDICRHQLNIAINKSNHNISTIHIIDLFHKASL